MPLITLYRREITLNSYRIEVTEEQLKKLTDYHITESESADIAETLYEEAGEPDSRSTSYEGLDPFHGVSTENGDYFSFETGWETWP